MAWIWGRSRENPDKYPGIKIPEIYCNIGGKKRKKCTPDCSIYDWGNIYDVEEDEPITEILYSKGKKNENT